jgi:hypothetical protein
VAALPIVGELDNVRAGKLIDERSPGYDDRYLQQTANRRYFFSILGATDGGKASGTGNRIAKNVAVKQHVPTEKNDMLTRHVRWYRR